MAQRVLPLFAKRPKATLRTVRAPVPSELQLHIAVVQHLRYGLAKDWIYFHCPNGEERDKRVAAKLKAMGTLPGVPDLCLISPAGLVHGLELKREGNPLSAAQIAVHDHARRLGWPFAVADRLEDALAVLREWGALKTILKLGGN
jgi:VRR-NUC domain-containing protein